MKFDFRNIKVLVIGDVMLDEYWRGNCVRVSPEAPVPVVNVDQRDFRLGGAANVALNCKSLGASVALVGSIGDDETGEKLIEMLEASSITAILDKKPNLTTTRKLRIIANNQQITRLDFEAPTDAHSYSGNLDLDSKMLEADVVILSDYDKGFINQPQKIIQLANQSGKKVLVDPKKRAYEGYANATLLTPNMNEFENMVGVCASENEIQTKAIELIERLTLDCLLITRGSSGMLLVWNSKMFSLPAVRREVFDVSGAGDTVVSGIALCLASGMNYESAMKFANEIAAIAVSKFGTSPVYLSDIEA